MIRINSKSVRTNARRLRIAAAGLLGSALIASCGIGSETASSENLGSGSNSSFVAGDSDVFHVVGPEGGPFPEGSREYWIKNTHKKKSLRWQVLATIPWLEFSDTGGLLGAGHTTTVTASIDQEVASSLAPGDYPADIVIRDARGTGGSELYFSFLLTVESDSVLGGVLEVNPEAPIDIAYEQGSPLDTKELFYNVANVGDEALDWAAQSDAAWLQPGGAWTGSLDPGGTYEISALLEEGLIRELEVGVHTGTLSFFDESTPSNETLKRPVRLHVSTASDGEGDRVTSGLVGLWDFEEGSGSTVRDRSGVTPLLDLTIESPVNTSWVPGALSIEQGTRLSSSGSANKLIDACKASSEITLEAWVAPQNLTQDGPARIITLSADGHERNFTLGQGLWSDQPSDTFNVRLRTTSTDTNGLPHVTTGAGSAVPGLQHVVYTRDASGNAKIYISGSPYAAESVPGDFSTWAGDFRLALANEIEASRPWLGKMHLVAIYSRALTQDEVQQNYQAGTGDSSGGFIKVTPNEDFTIYDFAGGGFTGSKAYTISNPGEELVGFTVDTDQPWVVLTENTNGLLGPQAEEEIRVSVDSAIVAQFEPGVYTANLAFANTDNGYGDTSREIKLYVKDEGDESSEKPSPFNTGWRVNVQESDLQTFSGTFAADQEGAVYENYKFLGRVKILADNITFRNCWFHQQAGGSATTILNNNNHFGLRFEYCEMDQSSLPPSDHGTFIEAQNGAGGGLRVTISYCNLHDFWTDTIGFSYDAYCEYTYFGPWELLGGTAHGDAQQTGKSSRNVRFYRNTWDLPWGSDGLTPNASHHATAVGTYSDGSPHYVDGYILEENWINGGGYMVYLRAKSGGLVKNCKVIGNKFGRDFKLGLLARNASDGGVMINNEFGGNVWEDTLEPVSNGDDGGFSQDWE